MTISGTAFGCEFSQSGRFGTLPNWFVLQDRKRLPGRFLARLSGATGDRPAN